MAKKTTTKISKPKTTPVVTPKTMRVANVCGSGLELILMIEGEWQHFWLNPGDAVSVPKVTLSSTANSHLQNRLIEVTNEN
tara:strand:- start:497 stop:739 length:243 start_codon:yes stop_codon:yes gene_type:complete